MSYASRTPISILLSMIIVPFCKLIYKFYFLVDAAGFCQIYLHCSSDEAIARNANRQQAVSMETIIKMAGKMEAPNQQAASWERNVVQILVENIKSQDTL